MGLCVPTRSRKASNSVSRKQRPISTKIWLRSKERWILTPGSTTMIKDDNRGCWNGESCSLICQNLQIWSSASTESFDPCLTTLGWTREVAKWFAVYYFTPQKEIAKNYWDYASANTFFRERKSPRTQLWYLYRSYSISTLLTWGPIRILPNDVLSTDWMNQIFRSDACFAFSENDNEVSIAD